MATNHHWVHVMKWSENEENHLWTYVLWNMPTQACYPNRSCPKVHVLETSWNQGSYSIWSICTARICKKMVVLTNTLQWIHSLTLILSPIFQSWQGRFVSVALPSIPTYDFCSKRAQVKLSTFLVHDKTLDLAPRPQKKVKPHDWLGCPYFLYIPGWFHVSC